MMTVPEAARRVGRDPETVRRWIRSGKLRSQKIGTQHLIDERDLEPFEEDDDVLPMPDEWKYFASGRRQPNWVKIIRESRASH
jgi:excisionase family DNA binding protein